MLDSERGLQEKGESSDPSSSGSSGETLVGDKDDDEFRGEYIFPSSRMPSDPRSRVRFGFKMDAMICFDPLIDDVVVGRFEGLGRRR